MARFVQTDALGKVTAIVDVLTAPVHPRQSDITGRNDVTPFGTFDHNTQLFTPYVARAKTQLELDADAILAKPVAMVTAGDLLTVLRARNIV